jgi:general secretion pathway protein B
MSYILDALKKAEGERQLGRAPGIHTPAAEPTRAGFGMPASIHLVAWTVGAVALVVALTLWWSRDQTRAPAPAVPLANREPAVTGAPAAPAAAAPGVPSADTPVASKLAQGATAAAEAKSSEEARPELKTRSGKETKHASADHATAPKPKATQGAASPSRRHEASDDTAPAKQAAPDAKPITPLAALPLEIRAQIPAFNITGFLYAGSRSERSILIDNRLMHEGDQVAAGLVLEEMRPSSAVFSYRGTRFSVAYR